MSKYSFDFKKKVVMEYLNGEGGWDYLTEKYQNYQLSYLSNLHLKFICL